MSVWDEAQAVLDENPQASVWNEAVETVPIEKERRARTLQLLNDPEKKVEDFVPEEEKDLFSKFFNLSSNADAARQRFVESDMVSQSTGMPMEVADTMHTELKNNGLIDEIREEWIPSDISDDEVSSLVNVPGSVSVKKTGKIGRIIKGFINKAFLIPIRNIAAKKGGLLVETESLSLMLDEAKEFNELSDEEFDALTLKEKLALPSPPRTIEESARNFAAISERAQQNVASRKAILDISPAETIAEGVIEIGTGVTAFVAKIALAKQIIGGGPSTIKDVLAFELVNEVDDGTPGVGALTAIGLRSINKVPFVKTIQGALPDLPKTAAAIGRGSQLTAQGGLLAGITKAQGGSNEDALVSFFIPFALATTGAARSLVTENAVGSFFRAKSPELFKNLSNKDVFRAWQISKDSAKVRSGKMATEEWVQKNATDAAKIIKKVKMRPVETTPAQEAAVTDIVKGTTAESVAPIPTAPAVRPAAEKQGVTAEPSVAAEVERAEGLEAKPEGEKVVGFDSRQDFQDRLVASQDLKAELKSVGRKSTAINPSGLITLHHATSPENAESIKAEGKFNEGSFFSLTQSETKPHVVGLKEREIIKVIKIDPRDIEFSTGTQEFFAPDGLVLDRDAGVWKSPKRLETEKNLQAQPTPAEAVSEAKALQEAKELPAKAPAVKAVPAIQIVSPGQAGPLNITFKATKDLPATKIIVDPKVRKSIQSSEIKIAALKTKLKQAKADKNAAVTKATTIEIAKKEAQIAKLKERQGIKLTNTIEQAKVKVAKIKAATEFSDKLRRDAISMVRAIPKEIQKNFFKRASEVSTLKGLQKLTGEIESGIGRIEKRESITRLKTAAKAINPNKMLPEFADTARSIIDSIQLGKLQPETVLRNSDMKEMAQQVLDNAREDSVAAFQAQQVLDELRDKTAKTFAINQLSVEAIQQITDTLTALRFQNEADTIAAKGENAKEAIRRRSELKKSIVEPPKAADQPGGKQLKKFKLFHDNLESVLDSTAGARPGTYDLWKDNKRATTEFIYDVLNDGIDNQIDHNKEARNIFRQILADNDVSKEDILNWSMRPEDVSTVKKAFGFGLKPVVHTFTLKDAKDKSTEFDFTVSELMSIFMHARNNHNLEVILDNGKDRFIDGKKQKIRGFTVKTINSMIDALTDQQKNVARQVGSKLMDGFNKDSINNTSTELEFFELARVENYWPARRSIVRGPRGKKLAGANLLVESMGLLKERVGTGNPMLMSGFFETVYNTNKSVSAYVGLAVPLREVKSVYTPEIIEDMENSGRADESKLITRLIERFEDQAPISLPLDTLIKKMLGGFAKSKLFLNAKIAPRQQISSFLISAYVDSKYITEFRGVATKELIAEITALSPQLGTARFEGLQFDRDIGDAFQQNELMNYLTGEITLIDKTALGMRFFDTNAIVDVYRAAKAEVIDKNPDVDIKSDDGQALLKDRFEWLVRHTQPMWHVKDRSLVGSDPRPLIRALTMFMSQREQLVRMVNNGISDFVNSEKTIEDSVRLGKSLGAIALNLAAFTIYNLAWAVLVHRKKRDVKDLLRTFFKDVISLPFFGKYIAKSFEIIFNIFADKPVFHQEFDDGAVEGILKDIMIFSIPNFARAGKHFVTKEKYKSGPNRGEEKWQTELLVAVDSLADAIASLKGLPYYGAKDLVRSVKAQVTGGDKKTKTKRIGGRKG